MTYLALAPESSPRIGALNPGELRVRTDWLADGTYVVFVTGEVDLSTAPALATSLSVPTLDRARSIVVDLSTCTFMDASGLMALASANERLSTSGSRLALVISGGCLLRAFDVTGLGHAFAIHASLTAALAPPAETWVDEALRRVSIRSANERLERSCIGLGSIDHERFFFICECGDRACGGLLQLSVAEYEAVREHAARFAISPNHENPEVERVVEQNGRFAVVETVTGLLSKPARETNPRWQRGEPW
jgi:anti-sigma B factor antagonist